MNTMLRAVRTLTLAAVALSGAGCAQMGTMGDILGGVMGPGAGGGDVTGEVRYVDTRDRRIELRTYEGRTLNVHYDDRTRVVYRGQEYRPTALEAGDEVSLRVQRDNRGAYYTDYIAVQRSVSERGGTGEDAGRQVLEGTVGRVDYQRGQFEVRSRYGGTVVVSLPYGAHSSDVDRFRRLRSGDYVRLEVELYSQQRAQLIRFL